MLNVIVLAAGLGKRMHSQRPKVLQPLAGRPMLAHVLDTARALMPQRLIVVYGHGGDLVQAAFPQPDLLWAEQAQQLGTGHAVASALPWLADGSALILYGDCPLIAPATLQQLIAASAGDKLAVLTVELADPTGYGRIVRNDDGQMIAIVEQKDASPAEQAIKEINSGIMVAPVARLREWLPQLSNNNAQGEYYLTDIVTLAHQAGLGITSVTIHSPTEAAGINDKQQLAQLERAYQLRAAEKLMRDGVTLIDPARFDLRGTLQHGRDVEIDIDVIIEGQVIVGDNVKIGPYVRLKDVTLGDNVVIRSHSVLEGSSIGANSDAGPFARIRPECVLGEKVHVGNFVELKKASLGDETKVGHLTYLGDATVGARVNVSAGVITCNYDGANKFPTVIGDDAFIGSDSQLIAPLRIGDRAYIAAGSTISQDAPAEALTICRARDQRSILRWRRPVKQPKPQ